MIRKLKFNQQLIYAKTFGTLLALAVRNEWYKNRPLPDRLIPVPLHPERLKERGFNQSIEIGRHLSHELGLIMDTHSVTRIKTTQAQSGLTRTARQQNIRGAFHCQTRFDGLHVVILDDVVTTGQTVTELSQVLQRQGAATIDVWCCARA